MAGDEGGRERNFEGAGAALEFALWSLDEQMLAIRTTDAKSEHAITLAVAILALFSTALTFRIDGAGSAEAAAAIVAAVVVAGCFVLAVWLFFRSYSWVNWYLGPDSERLLDVSSRHAEAASRQWLAEQILASVGHNAAQLRAKTAWSTRLFRAVLLEAVLAGAGVVVLLVASAAA